LDLTEHINTQATSHSLLVRRFQQQVGLIAHARA